MEMIGTGTPATFAILGPTRAEAEVITHYPIDDEEGVHFTVGRAHHMPPTFVHDSSNLKEPLGLYIVRPYVDGKRNNRTPQRRFRAAVILGRTCLLCGLTGSSY
ncbi:hypothetical protein J6590_077065 [Homalodisca vitripennis]|nr:hypothetical protein J6590_077065 [Homalodisca vitripennis]